MSEQTTNINVEKQPTVLTTEQLVERIKIVSRDLKYIRCKGLLTIPHV